MAWHSYDGTASQGFSKAVNNVIRLALGLETSETETGKKVFHSFRHTFRDFSREAGLQEYLIDLIGGWSTKKYGEGAGYGSGHSMKAMYELLERVDKNNQARAQKATDWARFRTTLHSCWLPPLRIYHNLYPEPLWKTQAGSRMV